MLASSFLDPVLGLDIHFEMVPTPAPVPLPIPNPFIGLVFDPIGLAAGIAIGGAIGAVMGASFQGPVLYWTAFPATNTGTEAKHVPGHILIPPGTAWAPFPKTPKPVIHPGETPKPGLPVKPENDAVVVFGSKTVTVMGSNAVRLGDIALSCSEPLRLPSSVVLAVPKGAPILIGGPMSLDILAAVMASLRTRFVSDSLHALISRLKPSRFRNFLHRAACFFTGHPVDVASGKVMTESCDLVLRGPLPLELERIYSSAFASRPGPLGHGWSHSLDQAVWRERGKVVLRAEDGRELEFDTFDLPDHRVEEGGRVRNEVEGLTLHCERGGAWRLVERSGLVREFAPVEGRADGKAMLRRIRSACDCFTIELGYGADGWLEAVRDSSGRTIRLEHDDQGRLLELRVPRPDGSGHHTYRRYQYDASGDLVRVVDVLGHAWQFEYETHLLVRETNRSGLSFYFVYDGLGEDAWCVRTWGDGGIYDHTIKYDKANKKTFVTDSLGHARQYHMNLVGQVVKVVDPLGNETHYEYHPVTLARTKLTDALGRTTEHEYDARGNRTRDVLPDGTTLEVAYDDHDRRVHTIDQNGGRWDQRYDDRGRLVERRAPDGTSTHYRYEGAWLTEIADAGAPPTRFAYDAQGLPCAIRMANGATFRWTNDATGRPVESIDPLGAVKRYRFDLAGRLVEIVEPDGNVRTLAYEPEGNVIHARDVKRDVRYAYAGMGRLVSRTEADTTIRFEYDTEEQLRAIVNEHGRAFAFELDERGEVTKESSFDGTRRTYVRDRAGQVVEIRRASGEASTYAYDALGRAIEIVHTDGTTERFGYRPDGLLVAATNDARAVRLERDPIGRILREQQDEHWVASTYDPVGNRTGMFSSFGAVQHIDRNEVGDVVGLRYESAPGSPQASWEARMERDLMGQEVARRLPGGVRSRWSRDKLGRPIQHEIWGSDALHRDVRYQWDAANQLRKLTDAGRGLEIAFGHDAEGNLAWAQYGDEAADLRMPDAVRNLFRRADRKDREYGPCGELLLAATPEGPRRYRYDGEGNLIEKHEPDGGVWRYTWRGNGYLARVERPDGKVVEYEYDALGRRIRKRFEDEVTHFIWHGPHLIHEWVTPAEPPPLAGASEPLPEAPAQLEPSALEELLEGRPSRGPPPPGLVTWLYEPGKYTPVAKLVDGKAYSILSDHVGAPVVMLDASGRRVWSAELGAYGQLRSLETAPGHTRAACPFRWPGQYEDAETGLYYNRFRYYDPEAGQYTSRDPLGLRGGPRLYAYVSDPLRHIDVFGMTYEGGRHRDTSLPTNDGMDSHHMPAKTTYKNDTALSAADGPAIKMDPADHRQTASNGSVAGSDVYRQQQKDLLDQARAARDAGDTARARSLVDDAIQMDIDDVTKKFNNKYDDAIMQMVDSLDDDFYDRITKDKKPCP